MDKHPCVCLETLKHYLSDCWVVGQPQSTPCTFTAVDQTLPSTCGSLAWISCDMLWLVKVRLAVSQPGCCLSCIWGLPSVEVLATSIFSHGVNRYQLHFSAAWYLFSVCCGQCKESSSSYILVGLLDPVFPQLMGPFSLQAFGGLGQLVASHNVVMDNQCTQLSLLASFTILLANISPRLLIVDEFNKNWKV